MLSLNAFLLKTQDLRSTSIHTNSVVLSYNQLQQEVLKTVQALNNLDIVENENVAIMGYNDIDYIKIVLALWQIKAVPVLINPKLPVNEIDEQLNSSTCKLVLISKNNVSFPTKLNIKTITYPLAEVKNKNDLELADELDPEATALIIFTSGTSGNSKGVELSFNSLKQSAVDGDQVINHTKNCRWLASLPFYHVGGFSIITRALLYNASVIIPLSQKTSSLADAFIKFKPNYCSLVPTQLKRLLEDGVQPNEELQNILIGGGVIDKRLVFNALENGWHITVVYGSTETASFITALTEDEMFDKPGSVGKTVKPNQIVIVNENKNQIPVGEVGYVTIFSTSLMKGYYDNERDTEAKLNNGVYYSDDVGYLDEDGYLFLESRKDDMIITGGENVYPNEVENRIIEHPDISDAVVFPIKDDEWGEIVSAVIVLNNNSSEISLSELAEFLDENLAHFKIPKKLFIRNELPRNEMGKLSKASLAEMISGQ